MGDAKYFERSWPARLNKPTELSEQACFVRDANPRRAFVNVLVPSFDMLQTRGSAMRYAVDQMASRLLRTPFACTTGSRILHTWNRSIPLSFPGGDSGTALGS